MITKNFHNINKTIFKYYIPPNEILMIGIATSLDLCLKIKLKMSES